MKKLLVAGLLLLTVLTAGCMEKQDEALYTTMILLHQSNTDQLDMEVLKQYDIIEVGYSGWQKLPEDLYDRTILYLDIYASSAYNGRPDHWHPGPGDLGYPEYKMEWTEGRYSYLYPWDENMHKRFGGYIADIMDRGVLGAFCDDWGFDRSHWVDTPEELAVARACWPFYPNLTWMTAEMKKAEQQAVLEVYKGRGKSGIAMFNGSAPKLPSSVQFHEKAGFTWYTWDRLVGMVDENGDTIITDPDRYLFDGQQHIIGVVGLDRYGNITPEGMEDLRKATRIAAESNGLIGVSLAYQTRPEQGGSIYQFPINSKWADPRNWPNYYKLEKESLGTD